MILQQLSQIFGDREAVQRALAIVKDTVGRGGIAAYIASAIVIDPEERAGFFDNLGIVYWTMTLPSSSGCDSRLCLD